MEMEGGLNVFEEAEGHWSLRGGPLTPPTAVRTSLELVDEVRCGSVEGFTPNGVSRSESQ
jgi:hypothetical protein